MNISGIRPSVGFYDYQSISDENIRVAQENGSVAENTTPAQAEVSNAQTDVDVAKQQTFGAYDYARQYNPDAVYEMKGADSDIRSLDVEKAVSDMQKDAVLHQYQYFVGQDLNAAAVAPSIRGAEDFSL